MKVKPFFCLLLFLISFGSCSDNDKVVVYQKFKDQTWSRFDLLKFAVPVNADEKTFNVILFVHHTKEFEFDALDFNMIMTTPSGEERIKEYHMDIRKKDGGFIGQCSKDSCEVSIALKKGIKLTRGNLNLEIENLIPRLKTRGLLGLGIRLQPAG